MICEIVLTGRSCVGIMFLFFAVGYLLILGILSEINVDHPNDEIQSVKKSIKTNWKPPGNNHDHLHVFVQISDLHLSAFQEKERGEDLLKLCSETLGFIKPEVVMITGDITDAKLENYEGSMQILDEWKEYKGILEKSNILNNTVWLDTRGNHDTFDVPQLDSTENLFRNYSVRGINGTLSYHYKHRTGDGDVISFIAVDACLDPGPKRPFNFFGMLKSSEKEKLQSFIEDSSNNSNATILFGHYPSSFISSHHSYDIRNMLSGGMVYLCGHLHTFNGIIKWMYARQKEGYLELELGDWKHERLYRVMALDHGMFSFADVPLTQSPVVLITNPKDETYLLPGKEPTQNMESSTHIRVLVFSPHPIEDVSIKIDGTFLGKAKHAKDSLYVLPWDAKRYRTGFHYIEVVASDASGGTTKTKQSFSMDGSHSGFNFIQRFLLVMDHTFFFKALFALTYTLAMLPLVFFKLFKVQIIAMSQHRFSNCFLRFFQRWMRRFCLLATRPKIFYPLLIYNIYLITGPWFIGYILTDRIGACFLYGLLVDGHFLLTSLTYLYGSAQMVIFNIPLTFYLAYTLDCTVAKQSRSNESRKFCFRMKSRHWLLKPVKHLVDHLFFFIIIAFQAYLILSGFRKAYGFLAFLICPMRTWAIILALFLHYFTIRSNCPSTPERMSTPILTPPEDYTTINNNAGNAYGSADVIHEEGGLNNTNNGKKRTSPIKQNSGLDCDDSETDA